MADLRRGSITRLGLDKIEYSAPLERRRIHPPGAPSTMRAAVLAIALGLVASPAAGQAVSQAGFVEGQGYWFPEVTFNDSAHYVGDALLRQEVVLRPAKWIQFVAGAELRANSHGQVEDEWRLDWDDRGLLRPRAAVRQLVAKITAGRFRLDVGKQFVRWGRADIVYPTDRFAPRDYLNVVTTELLPVIGARALLQAGSETFEGAWVPRFYAEPASVVRSAVVACSARRAGHRPWKQYSRRVAIRGALAAHRQPYRDGVLVFRRVQPPARPRGPRACRPHGDRRSFAYFRGSGIRRRRGAADVVAHDQG